MKDNSLDGHRGKVAALPDKVPPGETANATNFDDDYNEWELGIGDLIIDLDADIEKTNGHNGTDSFGFLGPMSNAKSPRLAASAAAAPPGQPPAAFEHQATVDKGLKMKIKRKSVGSKYSEIVQSDTKAGAGDAAGANCANNNGAAGSPAAAGGEAPNGNKPSKHSSGKGRNGGHREKKDKNRDKGSGARPAGAPPGVTPCSEMNGVLGVALSPLKIGSPAPPPLCSNSSPLPSLGASTVNSVSTPVPSSISSMASSPTSGQDGSAGACAGSSSLLNLNLNLNLPPAAVATSASPPMPNLTLKVEPKLAPSPSPQPCPAGAQGVAVKQEEEPLSPPHKRIKLENPEVNGELDGPLSPSPEMKDASVCASVGTITEPDCLGPCEPGTSVMLEGIVWQETDGGVLVVNVTWRGKTYVGTLLDCTKHDWAPPRFCESPTSDVDAKGGKGRGGKRGRGGGAADLAFDARNCVQSKLRNGKGRRTTVNSASNAAFTVPNSPAKGAGDKRKGARDLDLASPAENGGGKASKRNRKQQRQESPAPQPQQGQPQPQQQAVERGGTPTSAAEFSQPSSPVLIVCPEPHCGKKYKHINGLRYHQSHAHSGGSSNSDGSKLEESDSKDVTNSSDNEEGSLQEAASAASPSFANAVASAAPVEASPGLPPAPEGDSPNPSADLPTAAEAKGPARACSPRTLPPQDSPQDGEAVPAAPSPLLPAVPSPSPTAAAAPAAPLSAVTTSVIQSSNSVDSGSSPSISQAVTVSIPTSHVVFNQGVVPGAAAVVSVAAPSPPRTAPSVPATAFAQVASIASPSPLLAVKQEVRSDKYKPKSPLPASAVVRPPVVSAGLAVPPPPTGLDLASPLKPKPPGPLVLGDPQVAASPAALDAQKREKSKHKKKSKDRDRERKTPSLPLTPTLGMGLREDCCEPVELTPYPSLETVSGSTGPLPGAPHAALSPLVPQPPQTRPEDTGGPSADDSMNENMPSPAYSDISDANDTAPVLESEVAAVVKEKEDKVDKAIPDAAQSPAANINAYGMYTPYYSQPPYLIPSVSPQSAVSSGPQAPGVVGEKSESSKKDIDRIKENRPWSNPSGESRESSRQQPQQQQHHPQDHPHEVEKKPVVREEVAPPPNPAPISSPVGSSHVPPSVQDYSLPPQHYPYPYGYVQAGYPYSLEPSSYHVHMLENDPHYKQQYKQYLEEQQRLYKEQQQHHHHQQQVQQHQHHGHHQSSSHHQGSKSQHHPVIKEERDRSRDGKESKAQGVLEYSSKIQHSSSLSGSGAKEHDSREVDARPPSLPAQQSLKEKRDENHQILKENIELKSQMESQQEKRESKINQYEMAMIYERHREDMRRYYMYQDKVIEQQQARMEPGLHHHTHLHQTVGHVQASPYAAPLKPQHKEPDPPHSKSSHYADSAPRSSVVSPARPDHAKASTSSPKDRPKEYLSGKKERSESSSSSREEKKQPKAEPKPEPEGQKPTMETTGPPPPPTNSYAYLHPSYLQGPPHFPHMPFESAAHAMYRGGINPMIVSAAAAPYGASPYVHPQIRYVAPELAAHHPQAPHPEALAGKVLHQGPPKALDLLHHVSQQYTTTHKIHELQEHALMSPTPTSTPSSTPSSGAAARDSSAKSSAESPAAVAPSKAADASSRDASRSPPTQRHIHQHHHTHVGVGYPIYDPYGVSAPKTYT